MVATSSFVPQFPVRSLAILAAVRHHLTATAKTEVQGAYATITARGFFQFEFFNDFLLHPNDLVQQPSGTISWPFDSL